MPQIDNKNWFTEKCSESGTAFSFEIEQILHQEKTQFQNIDIYRTKTFGNLMVIDGFVMLTERDNFIYHEMLAHPVLCSHINPKKVVILGGGDCGTLKEVVKHKSVKEIIQVEIDNRVYELSKKYFPQLCESNNDPRVNLIFEDAIKWIKSVKKKSIDIIIVDSTDPIGPAEGLFTKNFYINCNSALQDDGLLVQQSESPLIHFDSIIKPMHQNMIDAGFKHTHLIHFPQPCYPSGWWSATIACNTDISLDSLRDLVNIKALNTRYYNPSIHSACFASPQFMNT